MLRVCRVVTARYDDNTRNGDPISRRTAEGRILRRLKQTYAGRSTCPAMPAITSATVTAFYLFDVAEQIDLVALRGAIGGGATSARLITKSAAPSYLQYTTPPVTVDGDVLDIHDVDGFKLRAKFFDYGVLSLGLTRPFAGEWPELIGLSQIYIENVDLERHAETDRAAPRRALCRGDDDRSPESLLSEDYLVVAVTRFATPDDGRGSRGHSCRGNCQPGPRRAPDAQPAGARRGDEQPAVVSG